MNLEQENQRKSKTERSGRDIARTVIMITMDEKTQATDVGRLTDSVASFAAGVVGAL